MYRSVSVSSAQEEATVAPGVLRIVLDDLPGRNDLSDLDGGDHPFRTRHLRHGVLREQDPLVGTLPIEPDGRLGGYPLGAGMYPPSAK